MKLTNETKYSTEDLRALFNAVNKHEGAEPRTLRVFTAKVPSWNAPTAFCMVLRGVAWSGSRHIDMGIPKHLLDVKAGIDGPNGIVKVPLLGLDNPQTKMVGQVYMHELAHIRGIHKHKEMQNWTSLDAEYLNGMTVGLKKSKIKKVRNLKQERYIKALTKVKAYKTKIKRDTTLMEKWLKKVRYYEKQ